MFSYNYYNIIITTDGKYYVYYTDGEYNSGPERHLVFEENLVEGSTVISVGQRYDAVNLLSEENGDYSVLERIQGKQYPVLHTCSQIFIFGWGNTYYRLISLISHSCIYIHARHCTNDTSSLGVCVWGGGGGGPGVCCLGLFPLPPLCACDNADMYISD